MKILGKSNRIHISESINIETDKGDFELEEGDIILINEEVDIKDIIKDLVDKDLSGSNEKQMAALELMKGLATSDEDMSNEFMKKVDAAITKIGKEMLNVNEQVIRKGYKEN